MDRFKDAILISDGACNPSGIARAIVTAIDQVRAEGKRAGACPAVYLMVHQLAALCGMEDISERAMHYWSTARKTCAALGEGEEIA